MTRASATAAIAAGASEPMQMSEGRQTRRPATEDIALSAGSERSAAAVRLLRKEQPYAEEPDGWLSEERAPAHPHKAGAAAPPNATAIRDAVAHAIGQIERRYRAQPRHAARNRRGADGAKRTVEHF